MPQSSKNISGPPANLLNDGTHHYFYDAENRLIQVDGTAGTCASGSSTGTTACYYYDARGSGFVLANPEQKTVHRVYRTGFTNDTCDATGKRGYVYDLQGRWLAEVNGNGGECNFEIYAGGRHVASTYDGDDLFDHTDWLGTSRLRTDYYYTSTHGFLIAQSCTSLPFGDATSCRGGEGSSPLVFTGKELDSESGLDNFGARFDSSSFGRFISPDPIVVTRRRLADPQRFNLYAYARNNPLRYTDPTGMDLWEKGCGKESDTCHKDYVGTWDKDHQNFTRTTIQTDSYGNIAGHDVNFDSKGIHIDGKYTGVFASNTQTTVVNGTGAFQGFQGIFNTNCRGTCAAGGILTASPGHLFSDLIKNLRGPNEWGDHFSGHLGDQYRGGNREGTDIHLSFLKGQELQEVHFDWRFPFGSWDGLVEHTRDVLLNNERQKTMTSDPPDDLVRPAQPEP